MNNLAKFRGIHGLTQEELGEKLGICRAAVSHTEKTVLSAKLAVEYGKVLGENPFALLGPDAFVMLPKTEEDRAILIDILTNIKL